MHADDAKRAKELENQEAVKEILKFGVVMFSMDSEGNEHLIPRERWCPDYVPEPMQRLNKPILGPKPLPYPPRLRGRYARNS